jgi:DNA replication and repair protein RecF
MRFQSVGFWNFRNLVDSMVPTDAGCIVLTGANGQGKTNFLEALYVLCYGSSFRTPIMKDLVRHGQRDFSLSAVVLGDDGLRQRLSLRFIEGKREILIDGREIRDRKELLYNIPCIVFCHDDIEFLRGNPENRRRFFDQTMAMHDPLFFDDLRRYRAVLRQRNAAIKEGYRQLLPLYDEQLAITGLRIQQLRAEAVVEFNTVLPQVYRKVSKSESDIHITYRPSWHDCTEVAQVKEMLARTVERDMKMLTTTSGIHRDQFIVMDSQGPFAASGSTGQLRLASLIFRIVQAGLYRQKTGKLPILLVDDVLLELDIAKRESFLEQLGQYSQAFFTFLPDERYHADLQSNGDCRYRVDEGRFVLDG